MGLPNNIQNGDVPDADKLMANFNYLDDKSGVRVDTFDNLAASAASAPAKPFLCYASDLDQLFFYTGNVNAGNGGFKLIG